MCGRYAITLPVEAMGQLFQFDERPNLAPRWNVAPTQTIPVVTADTLGRHLKQVRWGLIPAFMKERPTGAPVINARSETAWDKPMFRAGLNRRRCLVPADGFYEWRVQGQEKQPYFIRARDRAAFAMAGLTETWQDPTAGAQSAPIESAAILTCAPNALMGRLHDRMPVILAPETWGLWLDPKTPREVLQTLCTPAPENVLKAFAVAKTVGAVKNEGPHLIEPLPEPPQLI